MGKEEKAKKRIEKLFQNAIEIHDKDPEMADRYVELAWKIKLKNRVDFPAKWKNFFCRKCRSLLIPGKNVKIRINRGKLVKKCLKCGNVDRKVLDS